MTRVKDVMVARPVAATVPSDRRSLVRLFLEHGFAGFPVVKEGSRKLVGVVTRQDLFEHPDEAQVALLMDPNPATTYPEASLAEAARLVAEHALRLLPVVGGGNDLAGIVTPAEFLAGLARQRSLVSTHFERRFVPVHRATPAPVALEILRTTRAGALPVLDDDARLCGIITDGDLLRRSRIGEGVVRAVTGLAGEGDEWSWERLRTTRATHRRSVHLDAPTVPVGEVMVRDVATVTPYTTVGEAARLLAERHLHQLPVVDADGRLLGVVTDLGLLSAFAHVVR